MRAIWRIVRAGEAQTFEKAGIRSARLTQTANGAESLSLTFRTTADVLTFRRDERITITRNGANYWHGYAVAGERDWSPTSADIELNFIGPWTYFADGSFVASWKKSDLEQMVPRGFIGLGGDKETRATRMKCGDWLKEVAKRVQTLARQDADGVQQFDIGDFNVPVYTPTQKISDVTWEGAVQRIAEYVPELVIWWDHSGERPRLNMSRVSRLGSVSLKYGARKQGAERGVLTLARIAKSTLAPRGVVVILRKQIEEDDGSGGTKFRTQWRELKSHSGLRAGARNVETVVEDESQESDAKWDYPDDLAKEYFEHRASTGWQGAVTWLGENPLDTLRPGAALNISGTGTAAHAEMHAMIYTATHELLTGTTTAQFGPPDYLGFDSFRQLLAFQRRRKAGLDADDHHIDEMTTGESTEETYGFGENERPRKIGYARRQLDWCENGVTWTGTFLVKGAAPKL